MVRLRKIMVALVVAGLLGQPFCAVAGTGPRLVPHGSVKILETGVELDREIPVPAGMLMACKGQCYIEAGGMQLMGADGTVFAVHEEAERVFIMLQEGSLDFALRADAKPLEFKTPFDTLNAKPYSVPASDDAVIRGNLRVNEDSAVLTMAQGSLELTNSKGQTLLHAGNALTFAQSPYTAGSNHASSDTGSSLTGWMVGAGALAIIGATIAALSSSNGGSGGGDGDEVSPK